MLLYRVDKIPWQVIKTLPDKPYLVRHVVEYNNKIYAFRLQYGRGVDYMERFCIGLQWVLL